MVFPNKINTTTTQNQNQKLEEKIEEGQKVTTEASSRNSTNKALQPALRCSASGGGAGKGQCLGGQEPTGQSLRSLVYSSLTSATPTPAT